MRWALKADVKLLQRPAAGSQDKAEAMALDQSLFLKCSCVDTWQFK